MVGTGIDPSWGLGLHLAIRDQLAFGRDVMMTYGPLGFLVAPSMAVPKLGLMAYAIRIPLYSWVAWIVFRHLHRFLNEVAARVPLAVRAVVAALWTFPIAWAIAGPLGFGGEAGAVPIVVAGVLGADRILRDAPPPRMRVHALLGVAAGAALLFKFDIGVMAVVLSTLFALSCADGRIARARNTAMACVATIAVLWIGLGQPVRTFPSWLIGSIDLAAGFSAAMPWAYRPGWTTVAMIVAALLSVAAVVRSRQLRWPSAVGGVYVLFFVGALTAQSFRRYDSGHVLRFVTFLTIAVVVWSSRRSLVPSAAALVFLVVTALGLTQSGPSYPGFGHVRSEVPFVHPSNGWRVAIRTLTYVSSGARREARVAREHDRLGPLLAIPKNVRAVAAGKTVHVEPWEVSAAWIYGWKWRPLPVYQSYTAYTASLDKRNADALADTDRAPDVVVAQSLAIDGRVPRFETPDAQVTLVCWYRPAASGGGWTAFTRRARSACGSPTTSAANSSTSATLLPSSARPTKVTGTAEPGETVPLGASIRSDSATVVRFRGLESGPIRRTIGQPPTIVLGDAGTHRLIVGTATGAHVFAVPTCFRTGVGAEAGYDATSWTSFTLRGTDQYTYEIETIPYNCGA